MGEPLREAQLEDVLKANGEDHLLDHIVALSSDLVAQPTTIFGWQDVGSFVGAIYAARAEAARTGNPLPRCPLDLPAEVTVESFKVAVLEFLRVGRGTRRVGTSCLLSPSLVNSLQVTVMLYVLDKDPWMKHVVAVGGANEVTRIACIYVSEEPKKLVSIIDRRSDSLWAWDADTTQTVAGV